MGIARLNKIIAGIVASVALALPAGAQSAVPVPNPVTTPTTSVQNDTVTLGTMWGEMGTSAYGQQGVITSQSMSNPGGFYKSAGELYRLTASSSSATAGNVVTTYSLPAYSLAAVGNSLHVRIYGTTAANGNTKAVLFKFGTASITLLNAAANAKDFYADIEIVKTGASTQQINVAGYANAAIFNGLSATATQTDTAAIPVSVQLSTATTAADATLTGFTVYGEP